MKFITRHTAPRTRCLVHSRRPREDATACAYRWPVDHCAAFEAQPAQVSAAARAWLVTDEHTVGAESVAAGQNSGGRTIHPPSVQRTSSPTAGVASG